MATLALFLAMLGASCYLHNDFLRRMMHAVPEFFDVTPTGRIINRFSHDVDEIDNDFPASLRAWVSLFFMVPTFQNE